MSIVIIDDRMQFQMHARASARVFSHHHVGVLGAWQENSMILSLSCSIINMCISCLVFVVQSWTERAKGQSGEAADLKKRKRGGGGEEENGQNEAGENNTKKKKSVDPSSKLSAFAFNKN